ncbi:MAG TPA: hypothetical protein VF570_08420 [Pyrinomonadaceae bacterium]|jgi:hypothetical protein
MRRRVVHTLTALACALALAGCSRPATSPDSGGVGASAGGRGGGADAADALVKSLNSFTEELLSKVEKAGDAKAGVAEAQALLDARRGELASAIGALRRSGADPGWKAKMLEAEVDNTDRVHRLQLRYADEAARDAELKARLERLIGDYDALFR